MENKEIEKIKNDLLCLLNNQLYAEDVIDKDIAKTLLDYIHNLEKENKLLKLVLEYLNKLNKLYEDYFFDIKEYSNETEKKS